MDNQVDFVQKRKNKNLGKRYRKSIKKQAPDEEYPQHKQHKFK